MHNWMPYEAKRSRLGIAGRLVWWPSALMRMADHCCERPTANVKCGYSIGAGWPCLVLFAGLGLRVWGLSL